MTRHAPAPGQRSLPFTRSEQLRLRRDVCLPALEKFVLWVIDDHIGPGRSWTLTLDQIAAETGLSITSVRKHAAALVERGLVWTRKTSEHYHERRLEWFITWQNVEDLVEEQSRPGERAATPAETVLARSSINPTGDAGFPREPKESHATRDNRTGDAAILRETQDSIYTKSASISAPKSAPPSTPNATQPADDFAERKIGVVVVVKECGVGQFAKAVDNALAAGMTLDQIRDVCGVFESHPGRWTPAQLFERLTRSGASLLGPSEGWFGDSPEWTAREARRKAAQEAQERKEAEDMTAGTKKSQDPRESIYGAELDGMTAEQLAELLGPESAFILNMVKRWGRESQTVRPLLLSKMQARAIDARTREQQRAAALESLPDDDQEAEEDFRPFA